MDCADRISVQATDLSLRPVAMMRDVGELTAVTVRTFSRRRRFDVTVRRAGGPAFSWSASEVAGNGTPVPDGSQVEGSGPAFADPEDAYWAAIDAIGAVEPAPVVRV